MDGQGGQQEEGGLGGWTSCREGGCPCGRQRPQRWWEEREGGWQSPQLPLSFPTHSSLPQRTSAHWCSSRLHGMRGRREQSALSRPGGGQFPRDGGTRPRPAETGISPCGATHSLRRACSVGTTGGRRGVPGVPVPWVLARNTDGFRGEGGTGSSSRGQSWALSLFGRTSQARSHRTEGPDLWAAWGTVT